MSEENTQGSTAPEQATPATPSQEGQATAPAAPVTPEATPAQ